MISCHRLWEEGSRESLFYLWGGLSSISLGFVFLLKSFRSFFFVGA